MATITTSRAATDLGRLRARVRGTVVAPGNDGWDLARQAFNLAVDQRPAFAVFPIDEGDVTSAVRFARDRGLRVAPQRSGHGADPLGPLDDAMLLKTDAMQGVEIDVGARRARVRAGAKWENLVPRASEIGLAALHGSSPDIGIVGYSLSGGMGWYARKHGLATNSVTAIELVTADGRLRRVDQDTEPDLFWALRGGGGNFGVVTALEFELYPISEVYAGALFFPWERSSEVLHAWREWLAGVPDEVTSVGRILQFPPLPQIPEPLRGNSFVLVEAAYLGSQADGTELLRPLRGLEPAIDTFAKVPPVGLAELHMDPPDPVPALGEHQLLGDLPPQAIDDLVAVAGPGSGSPLLSVELRHLEGALARSEQHHGALSTLPGSFAMFAVGMPFDADSTAALEAHLGLVTRTLASDDVGRYWNFTVHPTPLERFFPVETCRRLRELKSRYDPDGLFRSNQSIVPADEETGS
jgi:FAD/FMN-containing dehydrogenase